MAVPGWWETHRQLTKGDRGADVAVLQRKLNETENSNLKPTGVFDDETDKAVKDFQRRNELFPNGKVGPLTFCTLFESKYRFEIPRRPKLIKQEQFTCWAAALESAMASWPGNIKHLTIAQMLSRYKDFLSPEKDISLKGFDHVVHDIHAFSRVIKASALPVESLMLELGAHGTPIVMVHDLTGAIAHTVVVFGLKIDDGEMSFLLMDPIKGAYDELRVGTLKKYASNLIIISAHQLL